MPFKKVGKNKYKTPSGRTYTTRQMKKYNARKKKRRQNMASAPTYCTHKELKRVFPQLDEFDQKKPMKPKPKRRRY